MNEPRRGEVWMVDLGMAAKVRPCLVISIGATEQDRALATLVPHTTSARNSQFEVKLKVSFLREGVFDAQSLVTIPHAKLVRNIGNLPVTQLAEVERAVAKWLGLEIHDPKQTG
jgi:mRNA interferase MazF